MKPPWRRDTVLPLAIALLCLGLLIFGLVWLSAIGKTMRVNMATNMLWVISQTEIELLRLDAVLSHGARSSREIETRFDVLASRLALIAEGPQLRYLESLGLSETVMGQAQFILSYDPAKSPLTDARVQELSHGIEPLRRTLHRAANQSMVVEWEELSARFESYRVAVAQVILSLALGIAAAAYLGWRLLRNQRDLLRAEEVRLRSIRLEQDLRQERAEGAYWRDFAAIISHQFRTPLAVIDSAAQRILRRKGVVDLAEQTERLEKIRSTVADMSRLVDAALLSGQLDNDLKTANCARGDLVAPIRALLSELASRNPERAIRLETTEQRLDAWFDQGLTLHAVMNLLENALRHSPGDVLVRLFRRDERVACAIIDTGDGIPADEMGHIFDRFRRGAHPGGEGSGLGLWMSRKLAELQGGEITVESWPDVGSVFTLWLRSQAPNRSAE